MENNIIYARDLSLSDQRALMLQMLYTYEISSEFEVTPEHVVFMYEQGFNCFVGYGDDFFKRFVSIIDYSSTADDLAKPFLKNWKIDRLSVIIRLILRYAVWEIFSAKADTALVINEAVELAKGYGEEDSYKFVNGVLDTFAKSLKEEKVLS